MAAVAAFCQEHFDLTLIIRAKNGVHEHGHPIFFPMKIPKKGKMDVPVPDRDLRVEPGFHLGPGIPAAPFVGRNAGHGSF